MRLPGRRWLLALALFAGIAGVWIAGAKLSQTLLLRGLSAEISSGDTDRALRSIAELEELDVRGVSILVKAAQHSEERVASAAQAAIALLLTRWRHEGEGTLATGLYERRLTQLSAALDESMPSTASFAAADWAHRTAERLLKLSDRIPPGNRVALIGHCEAVLDRTADSLQTAPFSTPEPPELASVSAAPIENPSAPNALRIRPANPVETGSPPRDETSEWKVLDTVATPPQKTLDSNDASWQPQWNAPEVVSQVKTYPPRRAEPFALAAAKPSASLNHWTDRDLLSIWCLQSALPVGDSIPREMISLTYRNELATRGYRDLREGILLAVLSNRPKDRMAVVNRLLTSSVSDAPNWLLYLARDEAPQVRRAAISALLTCRDRRILAVIHDLALHDDDPQVAELAPQIGKLLR